MLPLSAAVGKGALNRPNDVALVQAALKLIKDRQGRGYFTGAANGIISEVLFAALARFAEANGLTRTGPVRPGGPLLRALVARMPTRYRSLRALGRSSVLFLALPGAVRPLPPMDEIPLPTALKRELLSRLKPLSAAVAIDVTDRNAYDLTVRGEFVVTLTFGHARWIDPRSLAESTSRPAGVREYIASTVTRGTGWTVMQGGAKLRLLSRKAHRSLAASQPALQSAVSVLNYKRSRVNEPLLACMAAAHVAYMRADEEGRRQITSLKGCFDRLHGGDPTEAIAYSRVIDIQLAFIAAAREEFELRKTRAANNQAFDAYLANLPYAKEFDREREELRQRLGLDQIRKDLAQEAVSRVAVPERTAWGLFFRASFRALDVVDTAEDIDLLIGLLETLPNLSNEIRVAIKHYGRFRHDIATIDEQIAAAEQKVDAAIAAWAVIKKIKGLSKLYLANLNEDQKQTGGEFIRHALEQVREKFHDYPGQARLERRWKQAMTQ
jgi:hypothetical protein